MANVAAPTLCEMATQNGKSVQRGFTVHEEQFKQLFWSTKPYFCGINITELILISNEKSNIRIKFTSCWQDLI